MMKDLAGRLREKDSRPGELWRRVGLILALVGWSALVGCRVLRNRDTRDLSSARQLSLRGADALQQRKYADAESLFVEALRQSPGDERAQWGYSEVLWQRGEQAQATQHMLKAADLSGGNPDLLVRLGQMYLEQDDLTRALQQADAALRSHRNNPAAWALKGDVLRAQGQLEPAIDCYHRALIYRPDWPDVQVTLAELYRLSNRPQRALATLDRLRDQRSGSQLPPRAQLLRGQALADLSQYEAARMCLRQATHALPDEQSDLLMEFAQVQYQLGDTIEASLCLGRLLKQKPDDLAALRLLSEVNQALARGPEANVPIRTVSTPVR